MAAEFAMPVQQFAASPTQYALFNSSRSQQVSPLNSATATPHNASPTSPRVGPPAHLHAHTRQLRPPKSPLYIPAVLRPTDPPRRLPRQAPLTPPESMNSSFDDLDNGRMMAKRSTTDDGKLGLGSIIEAEYSIEGLGKVTALPTRTHWKPDAESTICDETTCPRYFSYFTRRHHCRRCGNIFCDMHSIYNVPLDQDANYHPKGTRARSCEHCWIDYRRWAIARSSRSNSESSDRDEDAMNPSTPTVDCKGSRGAMSGIFGKKNGGVGGTPESLAQSVPRNWNWSTF